MTSTYPSEYLRADRFVLQIDEIQEQLADEALLINPEFRRRVAAIDAMFAEVMGMPEAERDAWLAKHTCSHDEFIRRLADA